VVFWSRGGDLEKWINAVTASSPPELRSFVTDLRRDQDAVTAGLTLPWSSGAVEGHVNRIKMLKCTDADPTCSAAASCSPTNDQGDRFTELAPEPVFTRRQQSGNGIPPAPGHQSASPSAS
jgi:hypothetical protein